MSARETCEVNEVRETNSAQSVIAVRTRWFLLLGTDEMTPRLRFLLIILYAASTVSCGKSAPSPELAANGDTEVTAKLTAIGGDFPPNKLYDYMYVMKYHVLKVHRGKVQGEEILVGHYNPLKPRAVAEDKYSGKVGGNVDRFLVGDVHRMALEAPLEEIFMGGIINKHKEKGTLYRAIWTDRASE